MDEADRHGIAHSHEYNRNGGRCRFQGYGCLRAGANEQIGLEGDELADPATISLAAQRAGLDAAELRAGSPSDAELDILHEQFTKEALTAGVFGAPSLRAAFG